MADQPAAWTDPAILTAIGAAFTAAGAGGAKLVDWWNTRGDQKITRGDQRIRSEDVIREDLLTQLKDQREEIRQLRTELADARRELRDLTLAHHLAIKEHQDRYGRLLIEFADLKAAVVSSQLILSAKSQISNP